MTTNNEMERIVRSWLEPGLTTLTDDVLDAVLDDLPATPQRRPAWSARRIRYVGSSAKFSLAAAALVVVAIVGINLASRSPQPIVGNTPASPSPSIASAIPPSEPCVDLYPDGGTYRATVGPLGVTATMPAGWFGLRSQFLLVKAQCLFGGSLKLEVAMVSQVYTDACDWRGTAIEATTPAAVTNALAAQVGHETVGPTDVTIGGYPASRFEFSFPDDFDGDTACDDGTIWLFPGDPDPGIFNFDPGTTMTVYVVDVDGLTVAAVASFSTADTTAANIAALDTVVDSLRFEPSDVQAVSPPPSVEVTSPPTAAPSDAGSGSLPVLGLPGTVASPAGEYGWEGSPRSEVGVHKVIEDGQQSREATTLSFTVGADCLGTSDDRQAIPVRVAGLEGVSVEPYRGPIPWGSIASDEVTRAHVLAVADRTLCVFLSWHETTTDDELEAAAQVLETLRAEPVGKDQIRITFTLDEGWDVG